MRARPFATDDAVPLEERALRSTRLGSPTRPGLRVAGLFAGIGGLERGLHRAGHSTNFLCDIEPTAAAVLEERFAGVQIERDIREVRSLPRDTEMVVAGFPCQDLSQAGRTAGIEGSRSGLVGEVFRLLRRQRVPWVLLENVPFMLRLSKGRAMEVIVASLEALGYRWAYRVVTSQAFGLPHRRQRVFLLASRDGDPRDVLFADDAGEPKLARARNVACSFYWTEGNRGLGWAVNAIPTLKGGSTIGIPSPPAIIMPDGKLVTPDIRDAERLQGFPADWTKPAEAVGRSSQRWKLVGNAVTVDVAAWIGERLRCPASRHWTGTRIEGTSWPLAAWNCGEGRFAAAMSVWPLRCAAPDLHRFLAYQPKPLSAKATAGFFARVQASTLHRHDDFDEIVRRHLQAMSGPSSVAA